MFTKAEQKLEDLAVELSTRISKIEYDLSHREASNTTNLSDTAHQRENDSVLMELHREAQEELELINKALERIKNETFGACEKCGESINSQRLEAVPYASSCMECTE